MKPKTYNDFSHLKEAMSVKIEITFSTPEEIEERHNALQPLKKELWLSEHIHWTINLDKTPVKGKWITYAEFALLQLTNHNPMIMIGEGTRKEYFRIINTLNKR